MAEVPGDPFGGGAAVAVAAAALRRGSVALQSTSAHRPSTGLDDVEADAD